MGKLTEHRAKPALPFAGLHPVVEGGRAFEHRFDGYWRDVRTPPGHWRAHQDVVTGKLHLDDPDWPIRTTGAHHPPARIRPEAQVEDSLVAPACDITGRVPRPGRHRAPSSNRASSSNRAPPSNSRWPWLPDPSRPRRWFAPVSTPASRWIPRVDVLASSASASTARLSAPPGATCSWA
ncbi:MAG: hypothetical protein ACRD2W_08130 [Acidimicrobiales bacterium]